MHTNRTTKNNIEDLTVLKGKWIVIEGPDRIGKTTLIKEAALRLENEGLDVLITSFPNRSNMIGKVIDANLKNPELVNYQSQIMLFLADMMNEVDAILDFKEKGGVVLTDRYTMSTYAYAMAQYSEKHPFLKYWIKAAIDLVIVPDTFVLITPLSMKVDYLMKREGFGEESTETKEIQEKVLKHMDAYPEVFDNNTHYLKILVTEKNTPDTLCNSFLIPKLVNLFIKL